MTNHGVSLKTTESFPKYADATFEQNMVGRIRDIRQDGSLARQEGKSDGLLDHAAALIDSAIDYMKSNDDGYTAAEKAKVRDLLDSAASLTATAKTSPSLPSPAPAPFNGFVIDRNRSDNAARFVQSNPRPESPAAGVGWDNMYSRARMADYFSEFLEDNRRRAAENPFNSMSRIPPS